MQHENPPSLSTMLKCAGRFCFYGYMATRIPFIKTYSTPHELVQLLKTRGMEITDDEKVQHYLSHIGYSSIPFTSTISTSRSSRISSESGSIIMPLHQFSPPYCSFSKLKILGRKLTTKCAQVGQRACPCWVTCLPQVGKHVAPKWEKNLTIWHSTKKQFQRLYF